MNLKKQKMAENLKNDQIDFYQNQIPQNQDNQQIYC